MTFPARNLIDWIFYLATFDCGWPNINFVYFSIYRYRNNNPKRLIFFRGVETTDQIRICLLHFMEVLSENFPWKSTIHRGFSHEKPSILNGYVPWKSPISNQRIVNMFIGRFSWDMLVGWTCWNGYDGIVNMFKQPHPWGRVPASRSSLKTRPADVGYTEDGAATGRFLWHFLGGHWDWELLSRLLFFRTSRPASSASSTSTLCSTRSYPGKTKTLGAWRDPQVHH